MYCPECGTAVEAHFRFCRDCGSQLAADRPNAPGAGTRRRVVEEPRMELHFKILAWLLIGSGILTGMLSSMVFLAGGIIGFMDIPLPANFGMETLITSLISIVGVSMAVVAGSSVAAGVGILYYQTWGRVLALVVAAILLLKFPVGTAIGIYGLWVLLSTEGRAHYGVRAAEVGAS